MSVSNTPFVDSLLDAALTHVVFHGWSEKSFQAAVEDAGVDATLAKSACPRGAVDLAKAFHRRNDIALAEELKAADLSEMRFRDRVAHSVWRRLELVAPHKEAVRRAAGLFSLPQYAPEGAKLIWSTADVIWASLGDTSADYNWYSKRATLSGVYAASVLYWLGDESDGYEDTRTFIDRRIDDVMQIEKAKANAKETPGLSALAGATEWALSWVKPPNSEKRSGYPGQ